MLHDYRMEPLKRNCLKVYKSLAKEAITGSLGHQKLFSEIVGDSKNRVQVDHNITGLFHAFGGSTQMPEELRKEHEASKPNGVQVIDAEVID
jgi:hypothetical protein